MVDHIETSLPPKKQLDGFCQHQFTEEQYKNIAVIVKCRAYNTKWHWDVLCGSMSEAALKEDSFGSL